MEIELGAQVDHLLALAESTPLGVRGLAGVLGGVLCVAGSRLYPLAIVAPGLLLGAAVGLGLPPELAVGARIGIGLVVALAGVLLSRFVERVAVSLFGAAVLGSLVYALAPLALGAPAPWWGPVLGALLGLLLFRSLFKALLAPLTAWLGAMVVAWSLGRPDQILIVLGLPALGTLVQLAVGRKKKED